MNRLNADVTDDVLKLFEQKHYALVALDQALADPAYAAPEAYTTPYGMMWGHRRAKELGVKVNGALETEPPAWIGQYGSDKN